LQEALEDINRAEQHLLDQYNRLKML
jgi:hypothetical protein